MASPPQTPPSSPSSPPPSSPTGTNTALHSQPPSPLPFRRSSSVEAILEKMREELPKPISPLHIEFPKSSKGVDAFLDLETVNPSLSSPPSLSQPPPPQRINRSHSAEKILNEVQDLPKPLSPLHTSYVELPQSSATTFLDLKPHWSSEDESLLWQGIRECGKNWDLLSQDYVKSKTPEQIKEYYIMVQSQNKAL
ncbi:hypothetical protein TSUD_252780 [Trifolium subterraneum]|nr:hypothetical protein TSUD_252780 [Trifolium subterraneum]